LVPACPTRPVIGGIDQPQKTGAANSIALEELRGMIVEKAPLARGEAPLYVLDNVAYLRQGSSDAQAQPDEVISLVTQFAY
jgi:hypothetical protein